MTRGVGGEDIEGGLQKFLDTRKGGSEKIRGGGSDYLYTLNPKGGGAPKKLNRKRGGLLKFQPSSFNIFIPSPPPPPLVILNELSLTRVEKSCLDHLL